MRSSKAPYLEQQRLRLIRLPPEQGQLCRPLLPQQPLAVQHKLQLVYCFNGSIRRLGSAQLLGSHC